MTCNSCQTYIKRIQKLESNIAKSLPPADAFIHCGCVKPDLHLNNSGPPEHKLCYSCRGWRK